MLARAQTWWTILRICLEERLVYRGDFWLGTLMRFLPIVTQVVRKVGLAEKYNRVAGKAAGLGLMKKEDASIEHYVTRKALDGLYLVIGEQERQIRSDPVGTGSALLRKVFGALK